MSILNLEGAYENELAATGEFNPQAPKTALMLPGGQRLVLPTEVLLQALQAGDVVAHKGEAPVPVADGAGVAAADVARHQDVGEQVIPLVEEQMVVGKAVVETGRVRVRRETEEVVQKVSVPLANVSWEVEHVPVEQLVEAQPEIRQVGETTIFPLVEERVVVKRELWLREEVHVRKVVSTVEKSAEFPVKRDRLVEEHLEADGRVR